MTIPWQKVGTIVGLVVSSVATEWIHMRQTNIAIKNQAETMGREILKTIEKEAVK